MRRIFRSFFRKGENNIIKVFSLSLGLAIGLVLMAKVYFDISYDNFYPEIEKIYSIQSLYQNMNEYSEPDQIGRAHV